MCASMVSLVLIDRTCFYQKKKFFFKCSDLPARTGRGYFPFQKSQLTVGGGEGKTRGTIRAKQALDWPSIFKVFF